MSNAIASKTMRIVIASVLMSGPVAAHAQVDSTAPRRLQPRVELRFASGVMLPTGGQRHQLQRGALSAVQVAWRPRPTMAINGTLGWAKSRDLATAESPRVNAFAADLGAELSPNVWAAERLVSLTPFVGFGAGARSYDYRSRRADAQHNLAAYASMGGELGVRRVGVRIEARQYVNRFAPMAGSGDADWRSDMLLMAAVRFNRHTTPRN